MCVPIYNQNIMVGPVSSQNVLAISISEVCLFHFSHLYSFLPFSLSSISFSPSSFPSPTPTPKVGFMGRYDNNWKPF